MPAKAQRFIPLGMQRDKSVSKADSQFSFENHNIRITARENSTLLSITNEKGNIPITFDPNPYVTINIDYFYDESEDYTDFTLTLDRSAEYDNLTIYFSLINTTQGTITGYMYTMRGSATVGRFSLNGNLELNDAYVYDHGQKRVGGAIFRVADETPLPIFPGAYIGHCIINNTLVLFLHQDIVGIDLVDYIITLEYKNGTFKYNQLYWGYLGFSTTHPAETLGVYESESIQKVYWVDGINQPRMINIKDDNLHAKAPFDFVSDIIPGVDVHIYPRPNSTGEFPSGVVQYVVTLFNLYESETHPIYTSELFYTSPDDRGGSPEENSNTSFTIEIAPTSSYNGAYKYARIYSIVRTSIDAVPTVKLVMDVPFDTSPVVVRDFNTSGSTIDPTELLYKGGDIIYPYTMVHKDNTLFLGNYELGVRSIGKDIREELRSKATIEFANKEVPIAIPVSGLYPHTNTLGYSSEDIRTFHSRECYRFGIQFLHKTGTWSEVVYLGDKRVEDIVQIKQNSDNTQLIKAIAKFPLTIRNYLSDEWVGIRGCVVYPEASTREVLCQGIVCPTVFGGYSRLNNRPFAQSSWASRPIVQYTLWDEGQLPSGSTQWTAAYAGWDDGRIKNSHLAAVMINKTSVTIDGDPFTEDPARTVVLEPPTSGTWLEFRHNAHIPDTTFRNAEIQNVIQTTARTVYLNPNSLYPTGNNFWIDQSIVTLHSPDIEFDDSLSNLDLSSIKFRIVGYCQVTGNQGDMSLLAAPGDSDRDVVNISTFSVNSQSIAGMRSTNATASYTGGIGSTSRSYLVYPWHRRGSLDNHTVPEEGNPWYSELEKKVISNLKFCSTTKYLPIPWLADTPYFPYGNPTPAEVAQAKKNYTGISGVGIFKNDGQPMLRLPAQKHCALTDDIVYYGEQDEIVYPLSLYSSAPITYPITYMLNGNIILEETAEGDFTGVEPVPIQYKSSPHAVLALNYTQEGKQAILPTITEQLDGRYADGQPLVVIHSRNKDLSTTLIDKPFWLREVANTKPLVYFSTYGLDPLPDAGHRWLGSIVIWHTPAMALYIWQPVYEWDETGNQVETGGEYIRTTPDPANWYVNLNNGEYFEAVTVGTSTILQRRSYSQSYGIYQDAIPITSDYGVFLVGELYRDMEISQRFGGTTETVLASNKWEICGKPTLFSSKWWSSTLNITGITTSYILSTLVGDSSLANGIYYVPTTDGGTYANRVVYLNRNRTVGDWNITAPYSHILYVLPNNTCYRYRAGNLVQQDGIEVEYTEGDTYYQRYDHLKTYPYSEEAINSVVDIVSFMCETRVNIDGRYDKNRGLRSYLSVTPSNFNLLNPVYSQRDTFFSSQYIDYERFNLSRFPNSILWSKTKVAGEEIDQWTQISLLSTMDLDGDRGEIEALRKLNNEVYCFQPLGISRIFFNSHAQMVAVEQGSLAMPVELMNSGKVEGKSYITNGIGSSNKWSIVPTPNGFYFIDNLTSNLYQFSQNGIVDISEKLGFKTWLNDIQSNSRWNYYNFGGVIGFYDSTNNDVYFVTDSPDTTLAYSEQLGQFTSFYDYDRVPLMFNVGGKFFSLKNTQMWEQGAGEYNSFFGTKKPYSVEIICNTDEPIDKIFNTIEWRATITEDNNLDSVSTFNKVAVTIDENYQSTGSQPIVNRVDSPIGGFFSGTSPVLRRKFRMWRLPIPRDASNGRDRIRGPWARIKLSKEGEVSAGGPDNERMELHDIVVHFFE